MRPAVRRRGRGTFFICGVLAAAGAGLVSGGGAAAVASTPAVSAPTAALSWSAALVAPTAGYARPGATRAAIVLPPLWDTGYRVRLLVVATAGHGTWLRVLLPVRPNGTTTWIRSADVVTVATPWRIVVDRAARVMTVLDGGHEAARFRVVVGKPSTPTPAGLFAIQEVERGDPGTFMGSWVMPLAAHSTVLDHFDGGDGQIGIHGRGGASLADPLGTAASHGCVRMLNADIDWLERHVEAGTPVRIR
jgi:lipoprotein-anchoring transpeptidase ErfK/SrfK